MTKNLPSGIKRTNFCKMVLHFLTPSIEAGEEADHQTLAADVKVLPGQLIEVIIGAINVWEEQAAAQAWNHSQSFFFLFLYRPT